MHRITRIRALSGHRLAIEFGDGTSGELDLSDRLFGPMFAPLRDEALFKKVSLDAFGVPTWPNGADLAPDALYAKVRAALESTASPSSGG